MYFNTIAALTAQNPVPPNTEFVVGGYTFTGDGGGGTFIWIPTPPALPDDGGVILYAADPNGYFQRLFSGPVNVRWFGAKGDGVTDDTVAVNKARSSNAFANNGTLYFPIGVYIGASFIFDYVSNARNSINIIGDGQGSVLMTDGNGGPVVILGDKRPTWKWAKVSDIAIIGHNPNHQLTSDSIGVMFSNPSNPGINNNEPGRWVFERVLFSNCLYGVYKPHGNIANHFIDCTFTKNDIGVLAIAKLDPDSYMHAGCDRYSGGQFDTHTVACIQYLDDVQQLIIDGTIFESNHEAWAISIHVKEEPRMTWNAICLRNVWFESTGDNRPGGSGGILDIEGVRSVRIDDCKLDGRIRLVDSSLNLYNCRLDSDAGGVGGDNYQIDEKSSFVAYEHRYQSYPTSKIFVNSISYDGSQDILQQPWQPTSVWGPLRCMTATMPNSDIVVLNHFDTVSEPFTIVSGGSGTTFSNVLPVRVLGSGSGGLFIYGGSRIRSDNVIGVIQPTPSKKYIVWSIHTFLQVIEGSTGDDEDAIFGEILSGGVALGRVYFKAGQWACSYGMKLVDTTSRLDFRLEFASSMPAYFYITDYQIITFDYLHHANSYVNSREFAAFQPH